MTESRAKSGELRAEGVEHPAFRLSGFPAFRPSSIQFLAIGHFTHDVTEQGLILGGAASYSSLAAKEFGMRVGVVSAVGVDFLHYEKFKGISIALAADPADTETTTFQNIYEVPGSAAILAAVEVERAACDPSFSSHSATPRGVRRQMIRNVSATIRSEHVPPEWLDAEIVYLCPVANEVDASIVHRFPNSLIGASPQGWMRQWDEEGHVSARKWKDAPAVLPHVDVVIMSEEDMSSFPEVLDEYVELAKAVVLTRGEKGSTLFHNGQVTDFPAFPTQAVDPTGAGDVFALAFLREFHRTRDLHKASVFANCTASFAVEKPGTEGIPDLDRVLSRLSLT